MIPGPDQVVMCPHCESLAKYATLASGNTFGAIIWTDGKMMAPMLPTPPPIVRCINCQNFYWLESATEVGEIFGFRNANSDETWKAAPYVQDPSSEDLYEAIDSGFAQDSEREKILRILAWWRDNDRIRVSFEPEEQLESEESHLDITQQFRQNLVALAGLLDENVEERDRLMKAEVLRELGEFESALSMLVGVKSPDSAKFVSWIKFLCNKRISRVRQMR